MDDQSANHGITLYICQSYWSAAFCCCHRHDWSAASADHVARAVRKSM